ncbi:DUF397 domain-containing protein [Streptomyces sp. NBC_01465]|uniref:DUF397 domain-containing protein n=1 Tax=Streptomyces sp. NBC_01465 TaxID=2903878 RepID=UPI002E3437E5|nr:DUF397 domain-containing protein [Streptomyces sp. NBC_01465]
MIRKISAGEAAELVWFKSSYSDSSNPSDCVEVASAPSVIHVRDSKNAQGAHLAVDRAAWAGFVTYVVAI